MNGPKKNTAGRAKKAAPERDSRAATGRKPKASQARRTSARPASDTSEERGPKPERARSTQPASASSASRPRGAKAGGSARPRRATAAPTLDAPPEGAVFRDRDGQAHSFPESSLKRVAARLLTEGRKRWRYRPFSFPLFTDTGREQSFTPDFVVYDNQEAVIRVLIVVPRDSAEIWDRLGRLKRQYPMYPYELWTPDKLAQLSAPRARLSF